MSTHSLKCECGSVQGHINAKAVKRGTRILCYCKDCQAFAQNLGTADKVLDKYGGTDIFQVPASHMEITKGQENIRCLRLSEKGLYRWYAQCCKTPIGNTLAANWPFVGLIHNFMHEPKNRDKTLGPVYAHVNKKSLDIPLPADRNQTGSFIKVMSKILGWKIRGYNKPSPFFDEDGKAVSEPRIVNAKDKP